MGPDGFITTSGPGYFYPVNTDYLPSLLLRYISGGLPKDTIKMRLYDNIDPVTYKYPVSRVKNAVKYNNKEDQAADYNSSRDLLWAEYLGIPAENRHITYASKFNNNKLIESKYKPSINRQGSKYYVTPQMYGDEDVYIPELIADSNGQRVWDSPFSKRSLKAKIPRWEQNSLDKDRNRHLDFGESKLSTVLGGSLGTHTISKGVDPNRGQYVSYYDRWDLTPISGINEDQFTKLGTPVNIYDRIYLDDYYGVDSSARPGTYYGGYLPEVTIKPRKK